MKDTAKLVLMSTLNGRLNSVLQASQVDEMQEMATKYADTVEENRRLYNEVQDLKGNIRVFCRIRPLGTTGDLNPSCLTAGVDGEVSSHLD